MENIQPCAVQNTSPDLHMLNKICSEIQTSRGESRTEHRDANFLDTFTEKYIFFGLCLSP